MNELQDIYLLMTSQSTISIPNTAHAYMRRRFRVHPSVCSNSDEDGSTILHIQRDKIYNIIGVGSLIWAKLAASRNGLTPKTIIDDLSVAFTEVPRQKIEEDVKHILEGFQKKRIILTGNQPDHATQVVCDFINRRFVLLARVCTGLLLKFGLRSLAAFFGLLVVNMVLKLVNFNALYRTVERWPVNRRSANAETAKDVWEAVITAMTWYPKQAMCLQRSAVTTCLLRSVGIPAQMIIGCQKLPFLAHAWVEVEGEVVNDTKRVQETHKVLDRC